MLLSLMIFGVILNISALFIFFIAGIQNTILVSIFIKTDIIDKDIERYIDLSTAYKKLNKGFLRNLPGILRIWIPFFYAYEKLEFFLIFLEEYTKIVFERSRDTSFYENYRDSLYNTINILSSNYDSK